MPANKSEELMVLLGQALNSGDLEGAVALYEPEACVVPEPGTMVKGTAAIREVLTGFLAMKPTITAPPSQVIQTGDVAAVFNSWSLAGTGPDGSAVALSGNSAEVVRQQSDGTWRYVIDSFFGGV
jgi:uncharacterized protein (TIGR02246 family)